MSTSKTLVSNLNQDAEEFIPQSELRERSILTVADMIAIATNPGSDFKAELIKIKNVTEQPLADSQNIIAEALIRSFLSKPSSAAACFRLLKELVTLVSDAVKIKLHGAVFEAMQKLVQTVVSDSTLKDMQYASQSNCIDSNSFSSKLRIEAGDVPKPSKPISFEHISALVTFLRLLISNLNLSSVPGDYICIPPLRPCIDFCILVDTVARMQLHSSRNSGVSCCDPTNNHEDLPSSDLDMSWVTEKSWNGIMFSLFEGFSHNLLYFNALVSTLSVRLFKGAWQRDWSSETRSSVYSNPPQSEETMHDPATYFCLLVNRSLTCMRELLVNNCLKPKLLRSTVLDCLMYANEFSTMEQFSHPDAIEEDDLNFSNDSDDEKYADFNRFLIESGQQS